MNNYDRIKSMSVEEMAEAIFKKTGCNCLLCSQNKMFCTSGGQCSAEFIKQWLESEVRE